MPDLLWDDVRGWFDPEVNGVLPDVSVPGTTVADWQSVVDLVRSRGWAYEYSENGTVRRVPERVEDMLSHRAEANVMLKVWPVPEVLAIFRFWSVEQIDFDVDLRQLQGQERLDVLCGLLRAIGRRLAKPVLMSPEGFETQSVIGYQVDVDRVVVLPAPGAVLEAAALGSLSKSGPKPRLLSDGPASGPWQEGQHDAEPTIGGDF